MKKILLTLFLAICFISVNAQASFFNKYEDMKGVSTVYISKNMFNMMPSMNFDNKDIGKIAKKLNMLRVLSCEKRSLAKSIYEDAMQYYKREKFEEVMRVNDDGDKCYIFQKASGKSINEFVLISTDDGELSILDFNGYITLDEIKRIAK
jgi:hypothetical protein